MTWQPEPDQGWPDGTASDRDPGQPDDDQAPRPARSRRGRRRLAAFSLLLVVGLGGLAVGAIGIAHQLLPRQFTPAQKHAITTWEMERRWRSTRVGSIFPPAIRYSLPASTVNAAGGLTLNATLLGVSPQTRCSAGVSAAAIRLLSRDRCAAVLRATYADSSGSLVATVAVVVLSDPAGSTVAGNLAGSSGFSPGLVRALRVAGTPAARFGAAQRQLGDGTGAGPYVILTTVGFADGRSRVHVPTDGYLDGEIANFAYGLMQSARSVLGQPAAAPVCPGAPGC